MKSKIYKDQISEIKTLSKLLLNLFCIFLLAGNLNAQSPGNFTITNNSGSTILTCSVFSLNFSASSFVAPPVHYKWAGPTTTVTSANVSITQPGNYTVTISDSTNNIFGTQYLSITSDTTPPSSSVSPNTQTIACNTAVGAPVVSNVSGNVTHAFISPYGGSVISNGTATYSPLGPGTYTHILIDNTNGCQSATTFTLVSSQSFPSFNVISPQNYTLGCGSKSVATINIINGNTTNPAGGPVSYTFMPLSESNPAPSGVLSTATTYTVNTPGVYYVIVRDNTSFCATQIPVTIIQNTTSPNVSASVPTQILNCNVGQVVLQGSSTSTNVSLNWNFIGSPNTVSGTTVVAMTNANITQTLVNTFTFVVTDLNTTCTGSTVIPVYQNLFPPNALINSGIGYTISCATPTIVLTNQSSSGIPASTGFPINLPVVGCAWYAPIQPSLALSTTYTAGASGTYTMIAQDLNNGCKAQATAIIYGDCNLVGLTKNSLSTISIGVFPNPTNGFVTLTTEEFLLPASFEIYNSIGELVKKQNISSFKTLIDLNGLSNGIYIVQVAQNNQLVHTSKLIKN